MTPKSSLVAWSQSVGGLQPHNFGELRTLTPTNENAVSFPTGEGHESARYVAQGSLQSVGIYSTESRVKSIKLPGPFLHSCIPVPSVMPRFELQKHAAIGLMPKLNPSLRENLPSATANSPGAVSALNLEEPTTSHVSLHNRF